MKMTQGGDKGEGYIVYFITYATFDYSLDDKVVYFRYLANYRDAS